MSKQFKRKKTVQFQTIQFSIGTLFKYKYSLIVKNISISSYSFLYKYKFCLLTVECANSYILNNSV